MNNKMKRLDPKAILFDMDGVIVDSMPYHFIAWYEALRPWGVRLTAFDVYVKEGEKWQYTLKGLMRRSRVRPTKKMLQQIFEDRDRIFKKYFKRYLFHGVEEFLDCLRGKGYRLALVTGTPSLEMRRILPVHLQKKFECIVAGDMVRRGKPFPDPYLKAARALRLPCSDCLVIENAPLGIRSAKQAGMQCVAVSTSLPPEYLKEADFIFSELSEITGIIEPQCAVK